MSENGYNVIIIVSDTFRYDLLRKRFTVKPGVKAETPNLDRLAEDAVFFTRAYHASFPTVPNRHDLMTGRFTFTYSDWQPLPRDEPVIQEALRRRGYTTMLIADTPHILKDGYHYDRGFSGWVWIRGQENDRYRTDPFDIKLPCKPEKLRSVETTVQHMRNNALRVYEEDWIPARTAMEAVRWLEKNHGRRFMLYVDFFDPHEPWDPPRPYVDMYDPDYDGEEVTYPAYGPCGYLTEEELIHCRAMYAGEASLVDRWIGRIIEKVDGLGLWDRTALIFTSDHGFYLGEHGLIGKSIIMGRYHGLAPLYEEVAHIPLIMRLPDELNVRGFETDAFAQTPDIAATILELTGVPKPPYVEGESLIRVVRGERWVRSMAVSCPSIVRGVRAGLRATLTSDRWSLILAPEGAPGVEEVEHTVIVDGEPRILKPFGKIQTELYDLKKDPGQTTDVLEEHLDEAVELKNMFLNFLKRLNAEERCIEPWKNCRRLN